MTSESFRTIKGIVLCTALFLCSLFVSIRFANCAAPGPRSHDALRSTALATSGPDKEAGASSQTVKPSGESQKQEAPLIRKVAENTYRVGDVSVDTKQRTISFAARVNLREGVLEVLLCTEYGKTHESLLSTKVDPLHLNVSLLLLGLEGGHAVRYQGDPTKPIGSPVEIWFKVKEGESERLVRAEDWVYNTHQKRPMLHTNWVYVGSVLTKDGFMAQREGEIVTTFHDPFTLIDNPLPGGGDDTVYVPYTKQVPLLGTRVTVVIKAVPPSLKRR